MRPHQHQLLSGGRLQRSTDRSTSSTSWRRTCIPWRHFRSVRFIADTGTTIAATAVRSAVRLSRGFLCLFKAEALLKPWPRIVERGFKRGCLVLSISRSVVCRTPALIKRRVAISVDALAMAFTRRCVTMPGTGPYRFDHRGYAFVHSAPQTCVAERRHFSRQ